MTIFLFYVLTGLLVASYIISTLKALGLFPFIIEDFKQEFNIKNQSDEDISTLIIVILSITCVAIWPFILIKIISGE